MSELNIPETLSRFQPVLEKCSLVSGLSAGEMQAFLSRVRFEAFAGGDEILTEGNRYHGIWILLHGACEVVKHGARKDSRLAILEPGNVFGEMSFLHPAPHSASVRAMDQVETIRLMREDYDELAVLAPAAARKIATNIARVLSDRLRRMDEWTCELVERDCDGQRHKEWQDFRSKLYTDLFE
jgi:CRP-like cAMP-binding protein